MNILSWIITSSADPKKTSLFVKGLLISIAPVALMMLGWSDGQSSSFVDGIADLVFFSLSIISVIMMLVGLKRKQDLRRWAARQE